MVRAGSEFQRCCGARQGGRDCGRDLRRSYRVGRRYSEEAMAAGKDVAIGGAGLAGEAIKLGLVDDFQVLDGATNHPVLEARTHLGEDVGVPIGDGLEVVPRQCHERGV